MRVRARAERLMQGYQRRADEGKEVVESMTCVTVMVKDLMQRYRRDEVGDDRPDGVYGL